MKRCSQCGLTYTDESLNFCLTDGTPLTPVVPESQATISLPTPAPTQPAYTPPVKKSRALIWVALAVLVLIAAAGGGAAIFLYVLHSKSETVADDRQLNVNKNTTPKQAKTPESSPKPSPLPTTDASETPETAKIKNPPETDEDEEITPINWTTQAIGFDDQPGQIYKFECPPNGTAGVVWGSDIYTTDSSICSAAVHAGKITLNEGGVVTLEFRPGRRTYGSTVRNGITSNTYGEFKTSFVFR